METNKPSKIDNVLFLIIFIIGAIGIILLKKYNYSQYSVTLFPVVLMFGYFLYLCFVKKNLLYDDRTSDNFYYLGLLFTLTSLIIALLEFKISTDQNIASVTTSRDYNATTEIISNFGIALSTTIVGLLLRVTLIQLRQDPEQIENIARIELAEAASRFRDQLEDCKYQFKEFILSAKQSLSEGLEELKNYKKVISQSLLEEVAELKNFKKTISHSLTETSRENINNLTKHNAKVAEILSGHIDQFSSNVTHVLDKINNSASIFCKNTDEISIKTKEGLGKNINEFSVSSGQILDKIQLAFESFIDNSTKLNYSSQKITSSAEDLWNKISNINAPSDILEKKIGSIVQPLLEQMSLLKKHAEENIEQQNRLTNNFSTSLSVLIDLNKYLVELNENTKDIEPIKINFTSLNENLRAFNEIIMQHTKTFSASINSLDLNIVTIKNHRDELEVELKKSRESIGQVNNTLSSLANLIVEKLQ